MVNKKRLSSKDDFSDTYTCDLEFRITNSNGFLPPDSPEKLDSSHAAFDAAEQTPSMLMKSRKKRKVRAFVEQEVVTNVEPENDDGSAKGDSFDKLPSENVDKTIEIGTGGKESEVVEAVTNGEPENHDGSAKKGDSCDDKLPSDNESEEDGAADELCALQDALERTLFQHLGKYAQKQMLEKLRSLRAKDRKELSGEWKSLLAQEALLKSKKHSFSAKLANATFHN
ncbi:GLABROUS1 enhancer-binding protein-like 1 isoform X2 [Arabidopsis lyrata subsp. lyrata]|uniref:GLABROUS1 enhancer-binding protein-like 1 isoform X2 n=1 Tax=Arabidopsis lyrata subsp. lyrata TaxID=81972 RepID=UPI000A29E519|nr:GLABROUS1 enhancer-binding protein-like 1 isoform X2 [Arabidopsis lyrata subsp. lyrata]|eukprot:XP_020889307.1 GLABROUS1 enhancer-binding protein-like 1 isoform X2 [Arabidopsis lyrata subsp. lyrata]